MSERAYFEDFSVGDRVRTPTRTITEADLVLFRALVGTPLADGLYTLAISGGLMVLAGDRGVPRSTIALWGLEHVRFTAPARAGDTVHLEAEVTQTTRVDRSRGLIAMSHCLRNQRGEEIATYSSKLLVARRPAAEGSNPG
jgi:acyl dehydratase